MKFNFILITFFTIFCAQQTFSMDQNNIQSNEYYKQIKGIVKNKFKTVSNLEKAMENEKTIKENLTSDQMKHLLKMVKPYYHSHSKLDAMWFTIMSFCSVSVMLSVVPCSFISGMNNTSVFDSCMHVTLTRLLTTFVFITAVLWGYTKYSTKIEFIAAQKYDYLKSILAKSKCYICWQKKAVSGYNPCNNNHPDTSLCDDCFKKITICPLCRASFE